MKDDSDSEKRMASKRWMALFIFLFLCWPATVLYNSKTASGYFSYRLPHLILPICLILAILSMFLSNKIAALRFGEVEKKEQKQHWKEYRERRKVETSTIEYKKKSYVRKMTGLLALSSLFLILPLVFIADKWFHMPNWLILGVGIILIHSIPALVARRWADKKFDAKIKSDEN